MIFSEKNKESKTIKVEERRNSLLISIETERCLIRSYEHKDFKNCIELYKDPEVTKFFDYGKPMTKKDVQALIFSRSDKFRNNKLPLGLFSIFDKEEMIFIGQCDLIPTRISGELEVGCILHSRFHGKGIGTEVMRNLTHNFVNFLNVKEYKYTGKKFNRIVASVHPKNIPSTKLLRRLGMVSNGEGERFGQDRKWFILNVK